jgi:hypothetical protein
MCGKKEGLNSCSGCFQRMYCCLECQKKAWAEHKALCKAWQYVGRDVTDPVQVVSKHTDYALQLSDSNRYESQLRVMIEVLAFCKVSNVELDACIIECDIYIYESAYSVYITRKYPLFIFSHQT